MNADRQRRFARIAPALACPACRSPLTCSERAATCRGCDAAYPIRDFRIYFIEVPSRSDDLDRLKGALKRLLGRAYYSIGVNVLAPTFPLNFRRVIARYLDPSSALVIDAGCGNHRLHPDMICMDLFDYDAVDVVCSLDALPFRADSIDAFVSRSVLEHVPAPQQVVGEFQRCTRPGGLSIHVIPFLFPFHASPADFQRFTHRGHDRLFEGWELVTRTNPTGPVSALLLLLIESLSTILSFNIAAARSVVYLALCGLLFPLKFLDWPFVNRPAFITSAASILSVVRKPE